MKQNQLENVLEKMKTQDPEEIKKEFMDILGKSDVVMPAVLPKNTNPALMRKLMQNIDKQQPVPDGVKPQPCILTDEKGNQFLPVFTSETELKKNAKAPKFPLTMTLPFQSCIQIMNNNPKFTGIVVNAFTHNIIIRRNPEQVQPASVKTVQVTAQQYHFLTRQKLESFYLPKQLFEQKEALILKLTQQRGAMVRELYENLYDGELACPYQAEDFEVMSLNISETLTLLQITMPKRALQPDTCSSVLVGWDSEKQTLWYYAVLYSGPDKPSRFIQVFADGKKKDLGEAPSEGNELTTVLEKMQEEV
ncbi:MAG: SseB family protein [Clostridiaceae bacterium]|nr:SseB family protein [Clostridiaceae bacterium]